jgi:hypothetical protein
MLSIGVLTYNAPTTLHHSLNSYKESELLTLTDDFFVVIQMSPRQQEERGICEKFNIRFILLPDNGNMASGFKSIYENAKYENILFLENDFIIYKNINDTKNFYDNCLFFLTKYDVVRGRSRTKPGIPNYAYDLRHTDPSELIHHHHLAESIYWLEDPELIYPTKIEKLTHTEILGNEKWYKSTSESCSYTNNPYACSKTFFKENIYPYLEYGKNIEEQMLDVWGKNHKCIFGPGLFTHDRKI